MSIRKLAKLFQCSKSAIIQIINKFGNHYTLEDLPKSRRRKGPADPKIEENVVNHLTSDKFMSVHEIAKKIWCQCRNITKYQKKERHKDLQETKNTKTRSGKFYKFLNEEKNRILMDDKTYVKMNTSTPPGPQFYNAIK